MTFLFGSEISQDDFIAKLRKEILSARGNQCENEKWALSIERLDLHMTCEVCPFITCP